MARRHTLALVSGIAVAGLALSACGSNSLTPTATTAASKAASTGTAAASPVSNVDPALVAKIPAKIKAAGKIVVGTDATYAPNEFMCTETTCSVSSNSLLLISVGMRPSTVILAIWYSKSLSCSIRYLILGAITDENLCASV